MERHSLSNRALAAGWQQGTASYCPSFVLAISPMLNGIDTTGPANSSRSPFGN